MTRRVHSFAPLGILNIKRRGKKNTWVQEKKHYEKEGKEEARKHRFGIRSRKHGEKKRSWPKTTLRKEEAPLWNQQSKSAERREPGRNY